MMQETLRLAREKDELERQVHALKKQLAQEGKIAAEKVTSPSPLHLTPPLCRSSVVPNVTVLDGSDSGA
jgi:hypothetical protein